MRSKRDFEGACTTPSPSRGSGFSRLSERSEEHTSDLQSPDHLVCRLLLEKKKNLPDATSVTKLSNPYCWKAPLSYHSPPAARSSARSRTHGSTFLAARIPLPALPRSPPTP